MPRPLPPPHCPLATHTRHTSCCPALRTHPPTHPPLLQARQLMLQMQRAWDEHEGLDPEEVSIGNSVENPVPNEESEGDDPHEVPGWVEKWMGVAGWLWWGWWPGWGPPRMCVWMGPARLASQAWQYRPSSWPSPSLAPSSNNPPPRPLPSPAPRRCTAGGLGQRGGSG